MPFPYFNPFQCRQLLGRFAVGGLLIAAGAGKLLNAQMPTSESHSSNATVPRATSKANSLKAEAYYHFSIGHLYEEMAGAYGNRSDYVNKAIENFRLAMKEDPSASFLVEDIAELYRMSGRVREAVDEAQAALKANPDDINARRVLARVYTQEIGDAQTNHVDEGMTHRAIEQYKLITAKDPKDTESFVMLGRLDRLVGDSVEAEASFKKALALEPDNEDATTGLASVYGDRNDPKAAAELLEKEANHNPSPRSLVALANSYEQMKQYGQAADAYTKAIDLDPSRAELKGALAQDQALAGRYDDAIKTFQDLAQANPQEPLPYIGMAQIYREQKKYDKAEETIGKARAIDPENLDIRLEEARLSEAQGKTGDAIAILKGVIDTAGKRASGNNNQPQMRAELLDSLGSLYRSDKQYDRAVETFHQAAALNGDVANREEAQIIETYRNAKDYGKAQSESDTAVRKYPNDRMLMELRSEVLSDQGKTDEAIAQLKKLLDGHNDREIYIAMAETYEKAKDFAEMGRTLDSAEKLSKTKEDRMTLNFMRGAMYERQKKYDLAEKEFRSALDADPNNASALNYLGYMLADQGLRLTEAQDLIKRAVNLEPNNYAYLDSLGWVYYRQNNLPDAEHELRRSLEMMSTDPTIHDHLGDVYAKEGKLKDAIDQWQSSLNAYKTSSPSEQEPDEMAKVQRKLDTARVRLAKTQAPTRNQ